MENRRRKRFSRGYRKYMRAQKSKIRKEVLDCGKQKELIDQLYRI